MTAIPASPDTPIKRVFMAIPPAEVPALLTVAPADMLATAEAFVATGAFPFNLPTDTPTAAAQSALTESLYAKAAAEEQLAAATAHHDNVRVQVGLPPVSVE